MSTENYPNHERERHLDSSRTRGLVEGAEMLRARGHLSDAEFNAVLAAARRADNGDAKDSDVNLLHNIAGLVEWDSQVSNQRDLIQSRLTAELGSERARQIDSIGNDIVVSLKQH